MVPYVLEVRDVLDLDTQLAELGETRLCRCADGVTLECADGDRAVTLLARAGVRATPRDAAPAPPAGAHPATVFDLAPFAVAGIFDVVAVRPVDVAEATKRVRTSASWWRLRRADRPTLRALLRGEDRLIAWRRVVWGSIASLRSPLLERARPIVFDRANTGHGPERFSLARRAELTRWLIG